MKNSFSKKIIERYSRQIILKDVGIIGQKAISRYKLLDENSMFLETSYESTIVEERIWFLSNNVRCRSSGIKTGNGNGILQTSFASDIRKQFKD